MFKKLHLKLTLLNTAVIAAILFVIFSGIYFFMKNDLIMQSEKIVFSLGNDMPMRSQRFLRERNPNYFYIETDWKDIYATSPNIPIPQEDLYNLMQGLKKNDHNKGEIKVSGISYRYYKFFNFDNLPVSRIVFYNIEFENNVLSRLLYTLILIGTAAILLGFFSSLYLANKALIPIKKAWDKQKAFVADASHELRTPLSVIQTNLDVVMSNKDETVEVQSKWLGYIKEESIRMNKLVEDLLFLARSDSDEIKIDKKDFEFDLLVNNTLEAFLPVVRSKNITLTSTVDSNIIYHGDTNKIRQLLGILLDNAVKYNTANGTIAVSLRAHEKNIELEVSDTGIGIDKADLDRIFERFYRVDTSRTRALGGSGLGLSIAYSIVKDHDAKISVDSKIGEGSKFKITFTK